MITPFLDNALDEASLVRLIRHYANQPMDGLVLAGTTGGSLTLDDSKPSDCLSSAPGRWLTRCSLYLGLPGSDTAELAKQLERIAGWPINGYLVTCPYYTRRPQDGLFQHVSAPAERTERPIIIYNFPYGPASISPTTPF